MAKKKRIWKEIRNDYTENDSGLTMIDGYKSTDKDEGGRVIATVDADGVVKYMDSDAKNNLYAQEIIKETIDRREEQKQELVDVVIEKLKEDFESGDITVLDELLKFVKSTNLVQALPEEMWGMFPLVPNPNTTKV